MPSSRRPAASSRAGSPRADATRPATRADRGPSTPPRGTPRAERVRQRVPRLLTVRAMVMGVVGLLAFVLVYPTLHSYLAERAEVDQLRAQVAAATAANDDLRADLARWDDPAYVAAQARERLSFVMPGETAFRVVDPDSISADGTVVAEPDDDDGLVGSTRPWYLRVWDSVEQAGAADDASGATGPATVPDPATSAVPGPAVTP